MLMDTPDARGMSLPTRDNIVRFRVFLAGSSTNAHLGPACHADPRDAVARPGCTAERLALLPLFGPFLASFFRVPLTCSPAVSGHGGQQRATEGDEEDGYDETIYPLDHKTAGIIVDNDMNRILVQPLPRGCRLTAIFDCCHSGSALDLPYMYSTQGKLKEPKCVEGASSFASLLLRADLAGGRTACSLMSVRAQWASQRRTSGATWAARSKV